MDTFDQNLSVIEWNYEKVHIPYISPRDGKYHQYFVDFWLRMEDTNGVIHTKLIEVKPKKQTVPPKPLAKGQRMTARKREAIMVWLVDEAKWKAAKKYCEAMKWEWTIVTEDHLH